MFEKSHGQTPMTTMLKSRTVAVNMSEKIAKVKYLKMAFIFFTQSQSFCQAESKSGFLHQKGECEVATTEGNHVMTDVLIFNAPFLEVTLKVE